MLLLLEADPLIDIRNVGHIHSVVCRGVVYDPGDRERLAASFRR